MPKEFTYQQRKQTKAYENERVFGEKERNEYLDKEMKAWKRMPSERDAIELLKNTPERAIHRRNTN